MMRLPALSLESLIAVVITAEHGQVGSAARELGITQSAVDKRIRAARQVVGDPLFLPGADGLDLTEAGRLFVPPAIRAIEYSVLAEECARAHVLVHEEHLALGHSPYLAPRLLGVLRHLSVPGWPRLRIEHRTGLTASLAERVYDGRLPAAVGFLPVRHPELIERPIYEEPLVVCMPGDHPLARRQMIAPRDLDGEAVVAVSREPMPLLHQELEEYFDQLSVSFRVVADAFSPFEALNLVEQRAGICFLARSSAQPRPGIQIRPLSTPALTRKSGLLLREDHQEGPIAAMTSAIIQQAEALQHPRRLRA